MKLKFNKNSLILLLIAGCLFCSSCTNERWRVNLKNGDKSNIDDGFSRFNENGTGGLARNVYSPYNIYMQLTIEGYGSGTFTGYSRVGHSGEQNFPVSIADAKNAYAANKIQVRKESASKIYDIYYNEYDVKLPLRARVTCTNPPANLDVQIKK